MDYIYLILAMDLAMDIFDTHRKCKAGRRFENFQGDPLHDLFYNGIAYRFYLKFCSI